MKRPRTNEFIFPSVIDRVIDGDTMHVTLDRGCGDFYRASVRLVSWQTGIDTPEKYTVAGEMVGELVQAMIAGSDVIQVQMMGFGKWAGRFLGRVLLDGNCLCDSLIRIQVGRVYNGRGARGWTSGELRRVEEICEANGVVSREHLLHRVQAIPEIDTYADDLREFCALPIA